MTDSTDPETPQDAKPDALNPDIPEGTPATIDDLLDNEYVEGMPEVEDLENMEDEAGDTLGSVMEAIKARLSETEDGEFLISYGEKKSLADTKAQLALMELAYQDGLEANLGYRAAFARMSLYERQTFLSIVNPPVVRSAPQLSGVDSELLIAALVFVGLHRDEAHARLKWDAFSMLTSLQILSHLPEAWRLFREEKPRKPTRSREAAMGVEMLHGKFGV